MVFIGEGDVKQANTD